MVNGTILLYCTTSSTAHYQCLSTSGYYDYYYQCRYNNHCMVITIPGRMDPPSSQPPSKLPQPLPTLTITQ